MQAWRVYENGEPSEVTRLREAARPTPGEAPAVLRACTAAIDFLATGRVTEVLEHGAAV
ncbi:hypothetical protein [Streptomyces sp. NPDC001020]